jgi:hypothetical protein
MITPIRVGLLLSFVVVGLFVAMAMTNRCELLPTMVLECRSNFAWFLDSPPNAVGDTLAGFAGSLAFIWIVATVWLQSSELSEQRKVLQLQIEEMEQQRLATQDMARAMAAQAKIFEDEQRQRQQGEAEKEFDALLYHLAQLIAEQRREVWWELAPTNDPFGEGEERFFLFNFNNPTGDIGEYINIQLDHLFKKFVLLEAALLSSVVTAKPIITEDFRDIFKVVTALDIIRERLSTAQRIRHQRISFESALCVLSKMIEKHEFWRELT